MFCVRACIILIITCAVKTGSIWWNAGHGTISNIFRFCFNSPTFILIFYFGFEHSHEFQFGGDCFVKIQCHYDAKNSEYEHIDNSKLTTTTNLINDCKTMNRTPTKHITQTTHPSRIRIPRSILLVFIVEKSKKCLDFSVTLFLIHILICSIYGGFPLTWDWWIIHILGMIVMVVLGEYLCSKRELSDIPLLVL